MGMTELKALEISGTDCAEQRIIRKKERSKFSTSDLFVFISGAYIFDHVGPLEFKRFLPKVASCIPDYKTTYYTKSKMNAFGYA